MSWQQRNPNKFTRRSWKDRGKTIAGRLLDPPSTAHKTRPNPGGRSSNTKRIRWESILMDAMKRDEEIFFELSIEAARNGYYEGLDGILLYLDTGIMNDSDTVDRVIEGPSANWEPFFQQRKQSSAFLQLTDILIQKKRWSFFYRFNDAILREDPALLIEAMLDAQESIYGVTCETIIARQGLPEFSARYKNGEFDEVQPSPHPKKQKPATELEGALIVTAIFLFFFLLGSLAT